MAPKRKPLSESVKKSLKKKAEGTRFTYGQLAKVYRRGQGAYLSGGSRNVSMAAWAMGRVNSFVSGKGGARKADADILRKKYCHILNILQNKEDWPLLHLLEQKLLAQILLNLEKRKRRKNETNNPSKKYFKKTSGDTRPHKSAYGLYEAQDARRNEFYRCSQARYA